jgi:hypothetical protein
MMDNLPFLPSLARRVKEWSFIVHSSFSVVHFLKPHGAGGFEPLTAEFFFILLNNPNSAVINNLIRKA